MDIREMEAEVLAGELFEAFHKCNGHYYNMEGCRRAAQTVLDKLKEPVIAEERIAVGDVITIRNHFGVDEDTLCDVTEVYDDIIHARPRTTIHTKLKDIKLISKGPKRHVLEGQMFREGRDINGSSVSIPCSFGPPRQLRKFCGKNGEPGKTYRMELIEDGPNGE